MTAAAPSRPYSVLLADDDPGDVLLVEEAFLSRGFGQKLHTVGDGVQALEYLRDPSFPLPDLIILDLNMPRLGGRGTLSAIRSDPALARIPVVILTTSDAPEDVAGSYELHANAYVCKPTDLDDFLATVQSIDDFYLGLVRLPPT
ncbi:response regulator [Frankia sp. AgB32]|uniref:response regulator n=1 Tax=Frankia sp. AgB32 TaxID=631119 RepID=UPI00200FD196|nr:response regulator [Frankia sp. AgB32]MCK9895767.1 response regulator [Frankia sp. AgB32]